MSRIINLTQPLCLNTDVGPIYIIPLVLILSKAVSRPVIDELVRELGSIRNVNIVLYNEEFVINALHVIHSINVGLRCYERGPRIAKKLELNILCLMAAESQISAALDKMFGRPFRTLGIVVLCKDSDSSSISDSIRQLLQVVESKLPIVDVVLSFKCSKFMLKPHDVCEYAKDVIDILQCISETVLDKVR